MRPVFTAEEMRRIDARAMGELGIPGATLMENAGRGAAQVIARWLAAAGVRRGARTVVVCGKGGNGGDGFVVARVLKRLGARPTVLLATRASEITGDARLKLGALRPVGLRPVSVDDDAAVAPLLAGADVIVDALLGTGASGAPRGLTATLIERINESGRPVVALDVPSGVPADGGPPAGPAIRAALTVTFAGLKRGLVTEPGRGYAGEVHVVPIGVPDDELRRGITVFLLEASDVARYFPPRPRSAHKGTYGHLLLVAGSRGKTGAAALAAAAAMRSGAGLCTVATAESQQPIVAGLLRESMTEPLAETPSGSAAAAAAGRIAELAATRDALACGPGLGLHPDTQALARALARDVARPLALDADALTALAGHLDALQAARGPRCLTPHPGELARMLGVSVAEVERDRVAAAHAFAIDHRVHVVLKGAASVIAAPDGRVLINPTGNPGMASGGTGDVLTGMLGAFLARGLDPGVALACAVYVHGLAGDRAAARVGEESLIAGDVIEALPEAFAALRRGSA